MDKHNFNYGEPTFDVAFEIKWRQGEIDHARSCIKDYQSIIDNHNKDIQKMENEIKEIKEKYNVSSV
jgi:hypothetical protein